LSPRRFDLLALSAICSLRRSARKRRAPAFVFPEYLREREQTRRKNALFKKVSTVRNIQTSSSYHKRNFLEGGAPRVKYRKGRTVGGAFSASDFFSFFLKIFATASSFYHYKERKTQYRAARQDKPSAPLLPLVCADRRKARPSFSKEKKQPKSINGTVFNLKKNATALLKSE
jgi:hypothetical protein